VTNPYAPPASDASRLAHDGRDRADLFIDSLPPPILKAAALAWFATGALLAFFCLHILVDLRVTTVVGALAGVHAALGAAAFGVAMGLLRGRTSVAVIGFGVTPFLLLACAFALSTGALAGMMGLGLVVLSPALTAASLGSVAKVGKARELLAAQHEADEPPSATP
jgi:hypothetical protein